MSTPMEVRNARVLARCQDRYDNMEPPSYWADDDDSPSFDACEEEARARLTDDIYTPTENEVVALATKLYTGEIQW